LVLCRVRQGTFVLEHLAKITAIHPAVTGRAPDEVLGLILRGIAGSPPMYLPRGISVTFASLGSTVSWPGVKQ